jgi:hypothetical protein
MVDNLLIGDKEKPTLFTYSSVCMTPAKQVKASVTVKSFFRSLLIRILRSIFETKDEGAVTN